MNDLQIFNNEEFGEVRTAVINDKPMFCLADICKALELTQPSKVLPQIRKTGSYGMPKTTGGQIQLLAQGYTELEQKVNDIKDDVSELKENVPLYSCDIDEIQ